MVARGGRAGACGRLDGGARRRGTRGERSTSGLQGARPRNVAPRRAGAARTGARRQDPPSAHDGCRHGCGRAHGVQRLSRGSPPLRDGDRPRRGAAGTRALRRVVRGHLSRGGGAGAPRRGRGSIRGRVGLRLDAVRGVVEDALRRRQEPLVRRARRGAHRRVRALRGRAARRRLGRDARRAPRVAEARPRARSASPRLPRVLGARHHACDPRRRLGEPDRRHEALRERGHEGRERGRDVREGARHEPAAREVSLLQDVHRSRDGAWLRVPRLRTRVRRRPRACAARVGGRRRRDGGRSLARPHVPGGGSDRRADPGRAGARDGRWAPGATARSGRLLLLTCGRDRGPFGALRPPGARLARRPRRPQHGRELAQRQPVGHAAADGARRRLRPRRGHGAHRRPEPRPAGGGLHPRVRDWRPASTRSTECWKVPMPCTSLSTPT